MSRPCKPSIYLRAGVWHYRFTVAGKRVRGSTGTGNRRDAEAALAAEWHAAHRAVGQPARGGPGVGLTLTALAGLWLADLESHAGERGPRYVVRHRQALELVLPHFALPRDVTSARWTGVARELHTAGASWRTVQISTYSLRLLLRHSVEMGAIDSVPELRPPRARLIAKEQAPRRALTEAELHRVLAALKKRSARAVAIWTVMAYSGLRRGELARLTLRWLDRKAGVLHVPAYAAKSGEDEQVPLHTKARKAILANASSIDAPVFGSFDLRRAWRAALVMAKVDAHGLTAHHSARHTYGTLVAAAARGDVSAVMGAGRWRSLSMAQRYVHASAERARAAVRRLS